LAWEQALAQSICGFRLQRRSNLPPKRYLNRLKIFFAGVLKELGDRQEVPCYLVKL